MKSSIMFLRVMNLEFGFKHRDKVVYCRHWGAGLNVMVSEMIAFSSGLLVGAVLSLRYLAPMMYGPALDSLRFRVRELEAKPMIKE